MEYPEIRCFVRFIFLLIRLGELSHLIAKLRDKRIVRDIAVIITNSALVLRNAYVCSVRIKQMN